MIKTENKTMRIGVIMAVIALITLIGLAGTFAKYVSSGTAEDNARVAKWGIGISTPVESQILFSDRYANDGSALAPGEEPAEGGCVAVDSSDDAKVVAPGTHGSTVITLATPENAPEVAYLFQTDFAVSDTNGYTTQAINDLVKAGHFTMTAITPDNREVKLGANTEAGEYNNLNDFCAAVRNDAEGPVYCKPNTLPSGTTPGKAQELKLSWNWDFEGTEEGWDAKDTSWGDHVSAPDKLTFTFGATATQTNVCPE